MFIPVTPIYLINNLFKRQIKTVPFFLSEIANYVYLHKNNIIIMAIDFIFLNKSLYSSSSKDKHQKTLSLYYTLRFQEGQLYTKNHFSIKTIM